MDVKSESIQSVAWLSGQIESAVKEHGSVEPLLQIFSFFAPSGLPARLLFSQQAAFPEPLSALPDSEWSRLFEVLDSFGLIIRGRSEVFLLVDVQESVRDGLDQAACRHWTRVGIDVITFLSEKGGITRLDELNRLAWHTATLAGWALEVGLVDQLSALLKVLDREGHLLIDYWPERAVLSHRRGIQLCRVIQGEDHPGVGIRINNLGEAWHRLGDYSRADHYFQKALAHFKSKLGDGHQLVANALGNLALLRRDQKRLDEAANYFQSALSLLDKEHGLDNRVVNLCVNGLGRIIRSQQGAKPAIDFLKGVLLNALQRGNLKPHPYIAMIYNNMGILQLEIGENGPAKESVTIAMKIAAKSLPKNHPQFQQIYANYKKFSTKTG
ncbi:MAG: tetratricopeptide repeat protein [Magnetococcales bacterium]|nr:tetratricopeptide repeat protein [Magnetococcales bacterium]